MKTAGAWMQKKLNLFKNHRISTVSAVLILLVSGISAQATGILNTPTSGYLVCVNSKTKVVTHPGTSTCPKGSKKLILGAQGIPGLTGATGLAGIDGKDGRDGKDGKTLWNGIKDPEDTWGAPGDMFINSVTKTLFGPKNLDGTWPAGVSLIGPKGDQGPIGLTGPMGPQGPGGGSGPQGPAGPAGPTGATGPAGANGVDGTNGTNGTNATLTCAQGGACVIGDTGPGGGKVFYISPTPNTTATPWRYLEVAPSGWFDGTPNDPKPKWCSSNSSFLPNMVDGSGSSVQTKTSIGSGYLNTKIMLANCTYGAANVAASYQGGGKSDWFLPSKDELYRIYYEKIAAGMPDIGGHYWSSSESSENASFAWEQGFYGDANANNKNSSGFYFVRPIRAF